MTDETKIASEIAFLMPQIARWLLFDFFHSVDVPQTQLLAIMALSEKKSCRFTELSQILHIAAPTATGIVDRLEKSGYVKRFPDKEDRRAVNIQLTAKGTAIAEKLRAHLRGRWETILTKLSKEDAKNYVEILRKIQSQLG